MTKSAFSNEKYEATGKTKEVNGRILHQIHAKITIGLITAGTIGGWIETEKNLSTSGNAWVSGNARAYRHAIEIIKIRLLESIEKARLSAGDEVRS